MSSVAVTRLVNSAFCGPASALRNRLELSLNEQLSSTLLLRERVAPPTVPTGIAAIDEATGGLPRGALSEVFGPASSGRTGVMLSALAAATRRAEVCALVDASDSFDPAAAAAAGVDLDRLLWVRCYESRTASGSRPAKRIHARHFLKPIHTGFAYSRVLEQVLKITDLLLQGGGFGMVVLDMGDIPPESVRRIPLTSWFRFRRAVEPTATVLLLVEQESCAKTCGSLVLQLRPEFICTSDSSTSGQPQLYGLGVDGKCKSGEEAAFSCAKRSMATHAVLLRGMRFEAEVIRTWKQRKPAQSVRAHFELRTAI